MENPNPQCEDGFTAIANELLEALCRIRIPGESTQVFLTILRKTYGYKKVVDQISLSQFVASTGMKKPNICRALKQLETLNVIKIDKLVDQNDNTSRVMYRINKYYDTWEVEKRKQTRAEPLSKRIITVIQNDKAPLSKTITNVIQNDTHKRKKENTTKETKEKDLSPSGDGGFEGDDFYLTKKNRKLVGKRLESFNAFWESFNYKAGKAEAADAWYEIPALTNPIVNQILAAAEHEAAGREQQKASGKVPKMAQGWISGRRWEDELAVVTTHTGIEPITTEQDRQNLAAARRRIEEQL